MPLVREFVREIFGKEPNTSQHPDEAVASEPRFRRAFSTGQFSNVTLLDVTPLSLGIETFGGLMNVLIPRNTTIPCKAGEMFTNAAANQVFDADRGVCRANARWHETIGSWENLRFLSLLPARTGPRRSAVRNRCQWAAERSRARYRHGT